MLSVAVAALLAPALPLQAEPIIPKAYYRTFTHAHPTFKVIKPGEKVATRTLDSGGQDEQGVQRHEPFNPLTGPFYVAGAEPGDTLVVKVVDQHLEEVDLGEIAGPIRQRHEDLAALRPNWDVCTA